MAIGNEAGERAPLQPRLWENLRRCRDGENINRRISLQLMSEINRRTLHEDEIDFWMRNAASFDCILDRSFLAQPPNELARVRSLWPNEKQQIAVEMDVKSELRCTIQWIALCE
jgi:hypothetical protein